MGRLHSMTGFGRIQAQAPDGQLDVLQAAYRNAGVDPTSVSAVECHGTGTAIGDPIEIRTLSTFFAGRDGDD